MEHCYKCSSGLDNPVYIWVTVVISSPNITSSSLLHCGHSAMLLLCIPHHHAGVYFNAKYSADSHCGSASGSSNSVKNATKLGSPSYVGSGHD